MWKKLAIAALLCLSLSSCSMLAEKVADTVLGGSDPGLEVDANVGQAKTEGDNSVAQNANTAVSLDAGDSTEYGTVDTVINDNGLPVHVLLLLVLLAGWAIPSPEEMGHGVVRLIRALRGVSQ